MMTNPNASDVAIHTICMPERLLILNMSVLPYV